MIADISIIRNGFCDRLKLLTFYIVVAALRHEPVLYIKEEKSYAGPFLFLEFCRIEGLRAEPWNDQATGEALKIDYGFEPGIKPSLGFVERNKPKDLSGVSGAAFLELWVSSYRRIVPIPELARKIAAIGTGDDCLGLHIRMTDKIFPKVTDSVTPYAIASAQVPRVNRVIERGVRRFMADNHGRAIYLACDDGDWNASWQRRLREMGYRVLSNDARYASDQFRQTSGEDFVTDLFSLAKCGGIIGTVDSGVPICAAYINGSGRYAFAWSRMRFSRGLNYARWQLHHRYHMNLFDLHHSAIIRQVLKLKLARKLLDKVRPRKQR